MTALPSGAPGARITFIDVAKGVGILLVFYGHLIECFARNGQEAGLYQMRWIYCFHMPLFFFLAGLVYKERTLTAEAFLKRQTITRLVPVWGFNFISVVIILLIAWAASDPRGPAFASVVKAKVARFGWETLCGRPFFNVLVWFLVCLFVVELIQFALRKPLRRTIWLLASMGVFAGLTFAMMRYRTFIADIWGSLPFDAGLLKIDFWQLSSAVAAVVFYQAGVLFQRHGGARVASRPAVLVLIGAAGLLITLWTYNLNSARPVVFLAHGGYGNVGLMFVTAFAGIAFMVGLAGVLSFSRLLTRLGQITLGLMCLDGILHGVVNMPLAAWAAPLIPKGSVLGLTLACTVLTLLSVLVCLPLTLLIERFAPILLGRTASASAAKTPPAQVLETARPR